MKVFSAYNAGSDRVLSPRLLVVDTAREPIKVLKILMEGLAPHARNGIWLINFSGIPIARAASSFDLIYLDEEHHVLQATEISQDSDFEPFNGEPSSALILQPKTIARSKTFTGDRITLDPADLRSVEQEAAPSSKRTSKSPSRIVTAFSAKNFNVPDSRPAAPTFSGRLMRRASLAPNVAPTVVPAVEPEPETAQEEQEVKEEVRQEVGQEVKVVPISAVRAPVSETESVGIERPAILREPIPIVVEPPAEMPPMADQPLVTHSFPSSSISVFDPVPPTGADQVKVESEPAAPVPRRGESDPPPAPEGQLVVQKKADSLSRTTKHPWDRRLLYMVFPELKPSYRPDLAGAVEHGKLSKKMLSWLYPDLDVEATERKHRKMRRAPRIPVPGLVGFYFAGGPCTPHEIRNISVMGFYMVTDQRWMPGTIIRVTLQMTETDGDGTPDTITVLSRVVNWGTDGGGFEFVFPGQEDPAQVLP
jgi:hypothetical protein